MSKHTLAIFDSPDYVNLFLAFLKDYKILPFEPIGFTSFELLCEYLSESNVDLLLLSGETHKDTENIKIFNKEGSVKEIVLLGEKQCLDQQPICINRYRSMKQIIGDLIDIYNGIEGSEPVEIAGNADIISVYSLVPDFGRIEAVLSLAREASKGHSFLYINLERFSGLDIQYDLHPESGMSDLIYYYKTNPDMFRRTLAASVSRISGADVLLFPDAPEDLDEIPSAKLNDFLQKIATEGNYQQIYIDASDSVRDLAGLFNISKNFFLYDLDCSEGPGLYKKQAFLKYLSNNEKGDSMEKLKSFPTQYRQ